MVLNTQDVIDFFDRCAPDWDSNLVRNDSVINAILDNAGVGRGMSVLDVACGTGVLFPYYLQRDVGSVTGVDISPGMAGIAMKKYPREERIRVICADIESISFGTRFDRIVVYNALPHFPDPERLVRILSCFLAEDGRLTIAHGESREKIDGHHRGAASRVSNGLMTIESLKKLCDPYLEAETVISDSRMYQLSGVRRR